MTTAQTTTRDASGSAYHTPASSQLGDVLDSGLGPLDTDGTPFALAAEPDGASRTPPGYERQPAGANPPAAENKAWWARAFALLPDWLREALASPRAWQDWARSMVAALVMMTLMVARRSAQVFGAGSFFGFLASQMITPNMTATIFLLAQATVGVGMLLGWAWGAAAMAAANSVRSPARLLSQLGYVMSQHQENEDIKSIVEGEAFNAAFLDPATSAVFGAFLFIGAYALGWIRATKPKLVFLVVFATIVMDIMITIGPLIPKDYFMLATVIMKPAAAYMAVGLVCTLLIFPETLNHHVLKLHCARQLRSVYALLVLQNDAIHTRIADHGAWAELAAQIAGARDAAIGAGAQVVSEGKMLPLEVSYGRIGPRGLQAILKSGRELGSRAFAMGSFAMMIEARYKNWEEWRSHPPPETTGHMKAEIRHIEERQRARGQSLDELMPRVAALSQQLRECAALVLKGEIEWLEAVNKHRWSRIPADFPGIESRRAALHALEDALADFRQNDQMQVLDSYRGLFDEGGRLKTAVAPHVANELRPLFQIFVFTSTLVQFATTLVDWAVLLLKTEAENPTNRLQYPGRGRFVRALWANSQSEDSGENDFSFGVHDPLKDDSQSVDTGGSPGVFDDDKRAFKRNARRDRHARRRWAKNPDARKPVNAFQHVNRLLLKAIGVLTSSNGVFAARYAFISIALWIPAVCHSSAAFYYYHRGVWALIMAQCGLGVTAGEQVANFITRMGGTCLGVVVGMVAWYIGAPGNASGNAYGVVAATMVLLAPWLFVRVNCPPNRLGFWLMFCVTISFLVGYSWDDNKLPTSANQGTGASLAGRRALLVLIGFAAALTISLIPKPTSAKVLVRQGISKNIASLGELYALEVSAFETGRDDDTDIDVKQRREVFRHHFFKIFARLQGIQSRITAARLEPSMTGPWPKAQYNSLVNTQKMILAASAVLSGAYAKMNPKYCALLTNMGGIMEPMFIADCFSLFALLRHSLRNGTPLPPTVPIFERLIYHRKSTTARLLVTQELHIDEENSSASGSHTTVHGESGGKHSHGSGHDTLMNAEDRIVDLITPYFTWDNIHDEQFSIFATAIVSLLQIVNGLNQMHLEVLQLVGVQKLEGFEHLEERWARLGHDA